MQQQARHYYCPFGCKRSVDRPDWGQGVNWGPFEKMSDYNKHLKSHCNAGARASLEERAMAARFAASYYHAFMNNPSNTQVHAPPLNDPDFPWFTPRRPLNSAVRANVYKRTHPRLTREYENIVEVRAYDVAIEQLEETREALFGHVYLTHQEQGGEDQREEIVRERLLSNPFELDMVIAPPQNVPPPEQLMKLTKQNLVREFERLLTYTKDLIRHVNACQEGGAEVHRLQLDTIKAAMNHVGFNPDPHGEQLARAWEKKVDSDKYEEYKELLNCIIHTPMERARGGVPNVVDEGTGEEGGMDEFAANHDFMQ